MKVEKTNKKEINYSMSMLYKRKLNVAAYVRVSTLTDEQTISFDQQKKYYIKKICENENWNLVNVYEDDGISGTRVISRLGFQELVRDVVRGKIDLVLTKSISRFARNTVDILNYVRLFKQNNCAVYFEEESINTMEMRGELLLTILSSIAQQESENLSSHVRLGLEMKMRRGELIGFCSCYGYRYDIDTKELIIVPEEAEIVKKIYEMYLNNYTAQQIANYLTSNKIKTRRNFYKWSDSTIYGILKNEKYNGDLLQGKNYTFYGDKPVGRKNTGQRNMFYVKDHHEAIIDRETWNKVQEKLKSNKQNFANKNTISYSNFFKCGFCGSNFNKHNGYNKSCYACKNKIKSNCIEARYIPEDLLFKLFIEVVNRLNDYLHNRIIDKEDYDLIYLRKIVSKYLLDRKFKKFDDKFFKDLVRCIIVGEKDDPYKIRVILNSDMVFNDFKNHTNININTTHFLILFNFNFNYEIKSFVKDNNGIKKEVIIKKLKTSVEVVDED